MVENDVIDWQESVVLIGYPQSLGDKEFFISKSNQILDSLKDFLLISIDDSKGFIRQNYEAHILETINSSDITDKEVEMILNKVTHSLLFWDGENLNKFVYQTLLKRKPHKIIPIRTTKVVNKDRGEEYDVYIGRRGMWGNPFVIGKDGDRDEVIRKYKKYFYEELLNDESKKKALNLLKGKRLGCHCKPLGCHGDVIAEYLNAMESVDNH